MELDAGTFRFGYSKWVKLVLPNHSSRRRVTGIENNIHSGGHLMNSRTLAAIVLKGTTTRNGPRNGPGTCRSYNIQPRNELVRNVFPEPYQQ
jgi:hypothetical protein